jgi:hypothetical protein
MEQMKSDGLNVVPIDYNDVETPDSVKNTHPLLYKEDDAYHCILGPGPKAGISGQGQTAHDAFTDFDKHFQHLLENPVPGDPVSDFIQQRHI